MRLLKLLQTGEFNAFAIEVTPAMKYTQKLYKKEGGLVVDMFKTL